MMIREIAMPPGALRAMRLVLYRGEAGGDSPALLLQDRDGVGTLLVFDRGMLVPVREESTLVDASQRPTSTRHEMLVVGRIVERVPRGVAEGTEPRPSWYPFEALLPAELRAPSTLLS